MATSCYPVVQARAARVTRLDGCGAPVLGPEAQVVTSGLVEVGFTANVEEGDEVSVINFNGDRCVYVPPKPQFSGYGIEIQLCQVDPALIALLTGQQPVVDEDDNVIGFSVVSNVNLDDVGFALELWGKVPAAQCEPGQGQQYAYMIFPFIKGGVLGDFTINGTDAVTFTITNATTRDGSGWGVGPYDVRQSPTGPAPLFTPIDTYEHQRTFLTQLAPPLDECGAQPLGVEADGATAGTPGTYTPANSYGPADFADLQTSGLVADPATAWTAGQYIVLRDGSFAYWDGAAWQVGQAPQ